MPFQIRSPRSHRQTLGACTMFLAAWALLVPPSQAADTMAEVVSPAFAHKLPNMPGATVTALLVTYPPGGRSAPHHHAGSVVAYVLSGTVRSENSATGPARIYKAGESFFEPPGSTHLVSENASATEPASLLAIFVAADGATLKTDD